MPAMRLILIGPPGSGKGTQAKLLSKRLGLTHIATGDMLRTAMARGTPAGKKAAPYVNSARLVPDELVNEVVAERFRLDPQPQFVFDGYPRTAVQAAALDAALKELGQNIDAVIFLNVEDEEIVHRISGRRICPKCQTPYHLVANPPTKEPGKCDQCGTELVLRDDDREDKIRKRLKDYRSMTLELKPYYLKQGLEKEIQAQGDIEAIYGAILEAIR
jgi:adenylate kinase